MARCKAYREKERTATIYSKAGPDMEPYRVTETYGVCYRTPDCNVCYCKGNRERCDYYEEDFKEKRR